MVGRVDSNAANYIYRGSGIDSPEDGCKKTAFFDQPTGICSEAETIFLTDTGAATGKIISQTEPLADFLNYSVLYTSHGIHSNQHPILPEATSLMEEAVFNFEKVITAARTRLGGKTSSVEGPHGIPSSKTISGSGMTLEALKRIKSEIEAVNPDFASKVDVKALVTLLIEHFQLKNEILL